MKSITLKVKWAVVAILAGLGSMAEPVYAQSMKELTVSEPGRLFLYIPFYYAVERGYFEREGLKVKVFSAGRRDLAMKAVIAGETFASLHDPVEAALARSRGAAVKIIAAVVKAPANWLVGDTDITADPNTWKGKTVALSTPPNTQYSIFMKDLQELGWEKAATNEFKLKGDANPANHLNIQLGTWGTDLATLMAGRANFALMLEPGVSTAVIKGGKHVIKDYPSILGPFLFSTVNVSEDTIKKDPATVQKFVTALTRAFQDAHKNSGDLVKVAENWFPKAEPEVVVQATKNMLIAGSFGTNATFSQASYYANLAYLKVGQPDSSALQVKFEDLADTSFAEKAVDAILHGK